MAEKRNLDKLAASLSLEERQNLLEKLKGLSTISSEPLYIKHEDSVPSGDVESEYEKLPWYYRLWYFILSIFKVKSPVKIFGEHQIAILGRKTEERSPGLYDYEKSLLLPAFHRHIIKLKEAARFFYTALDTSVNRDKGAFFAFLGSLEMAEVHKLLQSETDPRYIVEANPDTPEMELRQLAFRAMDKALTMVTDDLRNTMYFDARTLNCLKELSSFLFDRVIMSFSFNPAFNGEVCSANIVRELLDSLNNILHSLMIVPPLPLLESLFVFILQERAGEQGFDINREIRGLLIKAEDALASIREFNKQVPLTWILRCVSRDMSLAPRPISGGEDWFVVYRDFWKRRIDSLFSDFMKDRRYRDLLSSFRIFLKGSSLKMLGNTQSETNPEGIPVKGSFGLSFLLTFYSVVFMPDINMSLRSVLVDGEFQRKENRIEFAESFNNLIKLEDGIQKFELEISPVGDYGRRYALLRQNISSSPIKRRKVQLFIDEVSGEAGKILMQAREASMSLVNVIQGILGKDTRGKYESLANLAKLTVKSGQFTSDLDETVRLLQRFIKLLDDIEAMENGR